MTPTAALCWELGGGYGHLTGLRPLAGRLAERGWRVAVVARNVPAAGRTFAAEAARGTVTLLQAPFRHGPTLQFDATPTYAHVLHNVGWADAATLAGGVACLRRVPCSHDAKASGEHRERPQGVRHAHPPGRPSRDMPVARGGVRACHPAAVRRWSPSAFDRAGPNHNSHVTIRKL